MTGIPLPPGKKGEQNGNPDADCEKYEPIMGDYCKYYVTITEECMIKFSLCNGYGKLK